MLEQWETAMGRIDNLPGYFDGMLIQRYLNDAIDINEVFLKDALASPDPVQAVGAAFRESIFQKPGDRQADHL